MRKTAPVIGTAIKTTKSAGEAVLGTDKRMIQSNAVVASSSCSSFSEANSDDVLDLLGETGKRNSNSNCLLVNQNYCFYQCM